MSIATRTWEGTPHRCPICRRKCTTEVSDPAGDSCCPSCGSLMWVQDHRVARVRSRKKKTPIAAESVSCEWVREYCDASAPGDKQLYGGNAHRFENWIKEQNPSTLQKTVRWMKRLADLLVRCENAILGSLLLHETKESKPKRPKKISQK